MTITNTLLQKTLDPEQNQSTCHNYFLVNFEPYQVELLIKNTTKDASTANSSRHRGGIFPTLLRKEKILGYEDFKQIVKIQDLQAFANSIIEIMVGKCEQTEFKVKHLDQQDEVQDPQGEDSKASTSRITQPDADAQKSPLYNTAA